MQCVPSNTPAFFVPSFPVSRSDPTTFAARVAPFFRRPPPRCRLYFPGTGERAEGRAHPPGRRHEKDSQSRPRPGDGGGLDKRTTIGTVRTRNPPRASPFLASDSPDWFRVTARRRRLAEMKSRRGARLLPDASHFFLVVDMEGRSVAPSQISARSPSAPSTDAPPRRSCGPLGTAWTSTGGSSG